MKIEVTQSYSSLIAGNRYELIYPAGSIALNFCVKDTNGEPIFIPKKFCKKVIYND